MMVTNSTSLSRDQLVSLLQEQANRIKELEGRAASNEFIFSGLQPIVEKIFVKVVELENKEKQKWHIISSVQYVANTILKLPCSILRFVRDPCGCLE